MSETDDAAAARPVLRVVTGTPSPEELAALLTVLLARTLPTAEQPPATPGWADRAAHLRRPLPSGSGAWRNGSRR